MHLPCVVSNEANALEGIPRNWQIVVLITPDVSFIRLAYAFCFLIVVASLDQKITRDSSS